MPHRVSWYYHRRNCETCARSQAFLDRHGIVARQVVDADEKFDAGQTLALARKAAKVVAVRGRSVTTFDMKGEAPEDRTVLAKLLGPYGNLRAPALIAGGTLIVGFNEEAYAAVLGV